MSYARTGCAAVLLLMIACGQPAERAGRPEPSTAREDAMPEMRKTPEPERTFVDGPPIEPAAGLLEWLEKTASAEPRPRIRLPVVVQFSDAHRLGISGGVIGVDLAIRPGAIQVALDDTAMGISLLDRVRHTCPEKDQTSCAVWLEGTWAGGPDRRFRVLRLVGANPPPPPAGGAPLRALIESNAE